MTDNEYITLAGKYCERMEWNHDAIPELAKCLELHDLYVVLKFARRTMDKQAELERENARLREALKWAEPYVPKRADCETRQMIEALLPNVQAQR